jgi:hypothetical protein
VNIRLVTLKRGLLLFWAVWFSFVFATNVLDGLKQLGVLPETWGCSASACSRYWLSGSCQTIERGSVTACRPF